MLNLNNQDLTARSSIYKTHLVNSLAGFKSANLIGTISETGNTNLAIFSSVTHLGASPPLVSFITRPDNVERHTLENIKQIKQFTINQVSKDFFKAAHQTSARYAKNECEFLQTGLEKSFIDNFKAPFVTQSQLKYAVELIEIIPIAINNTLIVIGQITDIFCDKNVIGKDGYIDIESLGTVAISGLDGYHISQSLARLNYAKPNLLPAPLKSES